MGLHIEGAALTHVGRVRSNNEDNYCLFGKYRQNTDVNLQYDTGVLVLGQAAVGVFDGMGGEEAGEAASLMAATAFTPCGLNEIREEGQRQMQSANEEICQKMKKDGIRMGATASVLYLDGERAISCIVGDSRCYLMRKKVLRQLSVDHSEARKMVELGILTPEEARRSMSRHRLTQHLGIMPDEFMIEPYFSPVIDLQPGDVFLLCSDGLTDMLSDEEIETILGQWEYAENMADVLVSVALRHGGKDNVTALVLVVREENHYVRQRAALRDQGKGGFLNCILSHLAGYLSG